MKKVFPVFFLLLLGVSTAMAAENTYKASTEEHPIEIINISSLEERVQHNMEKGAFGYIRGGAEDEKNMRRNTESFDKKYIIPRSFQGIKLSDIDISTRLAP